MQKPSAWVACPMLVLWMLLAPPMWSEEQPMVPLQMAIDELSKLEQTAQEQVALLTQQYQQQLTGLATDFAARVQSATLEAARKTAEPLLVELATAKGEREAYRVQVQAVSRSRWLWAGAAGVAGAVLGVVVGLLIGK